MRYVWSGEEETWVVAEGPAASRNAPGQVGWPIVSDALGVHHDQVAEAIADAAKRGVPTEFRSDGRAVLRDRGHRRDYLRAYGFIDRSSFTGYALVFACILAASCGG